MITKLAVAGAAVLVSPVATASAGYSDATPFWGPRCTGYLEVVSNDPGNAYTSANVYCNDFVPYRKMSVRFLLNGAQVWKSEPIISTYPGETDSSAEILGRRTTLPNQAKFKACAKVSTSLDPEVCTVERCWC